MSRACHVPPREVWGEQGMPRATKGGEVGRGGASGQGRHGGESVLETLDPPLHAGLVVVLEGLEEVVARLFKVALRYVHLAAALADDPHNLGVRDGRFDL